jgi:hypothetical protein
LEILGVDKKINFLLTIVHKWLFYGFFMAFLWLFSMAFQWLFHGFSIPFRFLIKPRDDKK